MAAVALVGCSSSSNPKVVAPDTVESTTTTTLAPGQPLEPLDGTATIGRADVRQGVVTFLSQAGDADSPFSQPTDEQIDCITDEAIAELGLVRLEQLDIATDGYFNEQFFAESDDLDFAAAMVAPLFECVDLRSMVKEDTSSFSTAEQDCIADAVVDDRLARLAFIFGTKTGSSQATKDKLAKRMKPSTDRLDEIEAGCT